MAEPMYRQIAEDLQRRIESGELVPGAQLRIPVFEILRVGFDQQGSPLRLTVTVYPADRNLLRFNIGQVPLNK